MSECRDAPSDAAKVRWAVTEGLPTATHIGKLKIEDAEIPCAVLDNGVRVLTEHGITTAMGSRSGGSKRAKKSTTEYGAPIPYIFGPTERKTIYFQ